ncbi:MAG: hypothetical protein HY268_24250, partial [Deltaproteobacteria bacterium]|nr:hypothetical protein [Deltaproteobacteria bacterium]
SYFDIQGSDDERKRREKVTGKVLNLDRSLEDTLPYLFALLGIEEQPSPLQQMDAQIRRRRTFEALKKLFLRESLNQPLILIFEDLHWIDAETQGVLDVLSECVASAKLLLLTNYRPEYRHEWGQKTYYTQLRLAPLGRAEAEELLTFLLGSNTSLTSVKQLILDKTQGTPFFMEEVVQTLAEEGALVGEHGSYRLAQAPTTLQLPSTVQAILAARIDRLTSEEKALLQQLSVIGREFPLSLVRQVITQPEADLYRLLASLQRKEFLYEQPAFPEVEYIFKHALTQEVAYGTVLQEQRKRLHERTGQALEALYGTTLSEHYSDLAHHYRRSPNTEKAIEYLQLAGQRAVQRSANTEAISHLTAALELLLTRPETPERAAQELTLRLAVGPALIATQGYAAPDVGKVYARARELCQQVGDTQQLSSMLWGSFAVCLLRAELQMARELAEQLLQLAESAQDSALLLEAHYVLGDVLFWLGEFALARVHLEQALGLYDPQQHRAQAALYGQENRGVTSLCYAALTLWCLGYADQALARTHEELALADPSVPPFSQAFALIFATFLHQLRREAPTTREQAEAAIVLSTEQEFPYWSAWGTIFQGWALAEQSQEAEGIVQMDQGLVAYRATGTELVQPYILALLAEAYGKAGQTEDGLAAVAEALQRVEKNDERFYEAEVYRIKGELLLAQEGYRPQAEGSREKTEEAERCFHKAIEVAQKQQAKSLELRAVMSLVRLWQTQGKTAEARQMLADIYGWFTEGFDTKDLQEAKALLEELA